MHKINNIQRILHKNTVLAVTYILFFVEIMYLEAQNIKNVGVQLTVFIVCTGVWLVTEREVISTLVKVEKQPFEMKKLIGLWIFEK